MWTNRADKMVSRHCAGAQYAYASSAGLMISEGQSYLEINPWLSVVPGLALFMLVAGVQFLTQSLTAEGEEERDIAARIV